MKTEIKSINVEKIKEQKCKECGSVPIKLYNEIVCNNCGLVLEDKLIDDENEGRRAYTADEVNTRRHSGAYSKRRFNTRSKEERYSNIAKIEEKVDKKPYQEKTIDMVVSDMYEMYQERVPSYILETAITLYEKVIQDNKLAIGRSINSGARACLNIALRMSHKRASLNIRFRDYLNNIDSLEHEINTLKNYTERNKLPFEGKECCELRDLRREMSKIKKEFSKELREERLMRNLVLKNEFFKEYANKRGFTKEDIRKMFIDDLAESGEIFTTSFLNQNLTDDLENIVSFKNVNENVKNILNYMSENKLYQGKRPSVLIAGSLYFTLKELVNRDNVEYGSILYKQFRKFVNQRYISKIANVTEVSLRTAVYNVDEIAKNIYLLPILDKNKLYN